MLLDARGYSKPYTRDTAACVATGVSGQNVMFRHTGRNLHRRLCAELGEEQLSTTILHEDSQ